MTDEELANKLLCGLSQEMMLKAELFDYLCWKEEKEQEERVPGVSYFLVLALDDTTCWGKTYMAAVIEAKKHDAKEYEQQ